MASPSRRISETTISSAADPEESFSSSGFGGKPKDSAKDGAVEEAELGVVRESERPESDVEGEEDTTATASDC